jgi:gamma-butyrobetaine dioxygenase
MDPRYRIVDATMDGEVVSLNWGDGHTSRFQGIWLRHQCECPICGTSMNALRGVRLLDLDVNIRPETLDWDADTLRVVWPPDAHRSTYAATWLRDHCHAPDEVARRTHRPSTWDASIRDDVPVFDFEAVSRDSVERLRLLETVVDLGFCKVINAPTDASRAKELIEIVGDQRPSHYGTYTLSDKNAVDNVGDVTFELKPHTDETYRLSTIGITVFQVLTPAARGGESTLVDGFEAVRRLREAAPADFDRLCRHPITGRRYDLGQNSDGRARWFECRLPAIRVDRFGNVRGVRMNERQIAPLEVPPEEVKPFYSALQRLYAILYDPALTLTFPLRAGEGLIFDNQRVLHGRTAYEHGDPPRSVLTSSVDIEEFHSNLRLLRAARPGHAAPVIYPQGMVG